MANNIQIPVLNPVKLFVENYSKPAKYNTKHFDDYAFREQLYPWQQGERYFQKFQTTDLILNHVISNYGPVSCKLIDCSRNTIVTGTVTTITSNYYQLPDVVYRLFVDLSTVPNGVYFLNVLIGVGGSEVSLISEPIQIGVFPNTALFEYSNTTNKGGIVFEKGTVVQDSGGGLILLQDGEVLALRVEAGLVDYQPGSNDTVFEDQSADLVTLNSQTFRSWKLVLGDAKGIPDYMIDRAKEVFACDTVLIDGKQFTKSEGAKWEPNGDRTYAKRGWTIEVREAHNRDGLTISNGIPLDQSVSVLYVVDPQLFGKTGEENIIKVQ